MRALVLAVALSVSGAAFADDLADANKALVAKSYPQALQLFSKLADAGNAEARFRLGEMVWYGQGVPVDRAKGDALFAQAAAAGIADAKTAMARTARRTERSADIAWWTSKYDGADLTSGKYSCDRPAIPEVSKDNAEIAATNTAFNAWVACYNGFIANLADAMPPGKRIPADILDLMSEAEFEQARIHLDRVYGGVSDSAQAAAGELMGKHGVWEKATVAYVAEANKQAGVRNDMQKAQLELDMHQRGGRQAVANPPSPPPPPPTRR
ncbi:sel1 repeat family protein [Massilia sp. RP-1-19]|uniref:Sel1 repeat family protein n=1 Tax=Massilia polaris TaxID=2728846 RepID=A0A848HKF0_9BURK|nr:sel1 repeat family protein [Massilia polaris]NML62346.1 sel1 repeat family protein [Massilia polaris]